MRIKQTMLAAVAACSLAGCQQLTTGQQLAIGAAIADAPALATATCEALTIEASHMSRCTNAAGATITFGQSLVPLLPTSKSKGK